MPGNLMPSSDAFDINADCARPHDPAYEPKSQRIIDANGVLHLPSPDTLAIEDAAWGLAHAVPTIAFWASQVWFRRDDPWWNEPTMLLGRSLAEEVAACLLCGYGVPAELGLAMFERLRSQDLTTDSPSEPTIFAALDSPVAVGERMKRYRFPRQKARQISGALARLQVHQPATTDLIALRQYLTTLPGVGWKTASFIVRNLGCDRVAVLDTHIIRGCIAIDVFPPTANVARDYLALEQRFIAFADAIHARPSRLDGFMWSEIRKYPSVLAPRHLVDDRRATATVR
jgi:N-glycosylase/DNA lyase